MSASHQTGLRGSDGRGRGGVRAPCQGRVCERRVCLRVRCVPVPRAPRRPSRRGAIGEPARRWLSEPGGPKHILRAEPTHLDPEAHGAGGGGGAAGGWPPHN